MEIKYPLLLDGGLSNQLEAQGVVLDHPLWTAKSLVDEPEKIVSAHLAYLKAGADCIITSSYQASVRGFLSLGFSKQEAYALFQKTVFLAEKAVSEYRQITSDLSPKYIAASIGPYGASLADGSEYRGNYGVSRDELYQYHVERMDALRETGQDFFAIETIPSFEEALVLAQLLEENHTTPAWMSFSCKDEQHISDGTKLVEVCQALKDFKQIFALGVNCSAPKYIGEIIQTIRRESPNKRIVVYPNSGDVYDAKKKRWQACESPIEFCQQAKQWLALGVDIIGGCCQINPEHIQKISTYLHPSEKGCVNELDS